MIGALEQAAVSRVLTSGCLVQGAEVAQFEVEFAATVAGRYCVAVSSGTAALQLGLRAMGIGPGDEVIVPSFTFCATANAVVATGATPVFVDIDPATYCVDPVSAAAAITPRTAAIIPVHLYGHPADMTAVNELGERHNLLVFEDACQAQGAQYRGGPTGALAHAAAFSFYPSKLMTTGEGGMFVCPDENVAEKVRILRNQGIVAGTLTAIGYNARMTDIAGAIGRAQLVRVPEFLGRRRDNAARLRTSLPHEAVPHIAADIVHSFHQFTIRLPNRPRLQRAFESTQIDTRVYYETPLHESGVFVGSPAVCLPVSEDAARTVLSIPVGPHLSSADLDRIEEVLAGL
jgi:perosamine synthetase